MNFGIIAAGEGSRLAEEGVETPKPLVRIDGKPMIERLLDIFSKHAPCRIAVCINEFMTEVREFVEGYRPAEGVDLQLMTKTTPSSMHTFSEISELLKGRGRFVVTTVDTIFRDSDFDAYVRAWEKADRSCDALMGVTDYIDDEKPLYVETEGERITAFLDAAPAHPKYISGGIYGLDDSAVHVLDGCLAAGVSRMRNFQRALIAEGLDVRAWPMGKIMDVDHAGDIEKANEFLKQQ